MKKRSLAVFAALAMLLSLTANVWAAADDNTASSISTQSTEVAEQSAVLTFSESGITETQAGIGYSITATTLTITADGTYRICGSCSDGSIVVSKGLTGVTLLLDDLSLASSATAPIVIKKSAAVSIHLEGSSTLTDNEDPANETSIDETVAGAYEGAAIKVKSGSTVTFCGEGNLSIVANSKNGIKAARLLH